MILSRLSTKNPLAKNPLARLEPGGAQTTHRATRRRHQWHCLWPALLAGGISACGPKQPVIPKTTEAIARRCYATVAAPERTPQLSPSESMEDGTFLILWAITELPNERGSCIVDSSGTVLLLTSNADEQSPAEKPTEEPTGEPETPTEKPETPTDEPETPAPPTEAESTE